MNEFDTSDDALDAVLRGNREAYRQVVYEHEGNIRMLLAGMLPNRESLDDVTQETFIHAYLHLDEYTPGTNFRAWLRTIARNLALNERRRWFMRQNKFVAIDCVAEDLSEDIDALAPSLADSAVASLHACIAKLADNARKIVQGYYFDGLSCLQLATRHDRKDAWVRIVLHRARVALAKCLANEGVNSHVGA